MEKSLLKIAPCFRLHKIIPVFFFAFIVNCTLLTVNCYSQWVQQTVPVSKPIQGIKFIDSLKGWACSGTTTPPDTAFILHTTNGGTNWFTQFSIYPFQFTSLSIVNNLVGYAGGDSIGRPKLFKTTDGGINWFTLPVNNNMAFIQLLFFNVDTGWENGGVIGPDIRLTTDGGLTWQVRTSGIFSITERLFFLNYNTGFCAASFNLYKTTNAGINWVQIGNFMNAVRCTYFLNDNTGWAGTDINKIYFTSNAGVNWNLQSPPPNSSSSVYDFYFINQNTGWAGTGFNKIFKTTNSGINWGYQIDTSGSYRISIIDSIHGWSCNNGISHTLNGGGIILAVHQISNETPLSYVLYQNFPNPFNPSTKIKYQILNSKYVTLKVYDVLGKEVSILVNEKQAAGIYETEFDGTHLPSGIYFYHLFTEDFTETRKMILIK